MSIVMHTIPVEEAVGTVLCQDITRIIPGVEKGPVFRKGHVVSADDIPVLLSIGKEHLYVYDPGPGVLHEDEAAVRIARAVAGDNLAMSEPKEGKVNFSATCRGLLQVDVDMLMRVNSFGEISLATLHSMQEVRPGQGVAGTRIIPLAIEEEKIAGLEELVKAPVISVMPFGRMNAGIVTTGSEVYSGRIKDCFGSVLREKFAGYGCGVIGQKIVNDDPAMIAQAIRGFLDRGADMVVCTGGMSVDPDDRTPGAIRSVAEDVVAYGAPVLPGAMFMLAYAQQGGRRVPVIGLPGCGMYYKTSVFDLIFIRILAGMTVTAADIARLGHGGYCMGCDECRYPRCAFGKF